MRGKAGKLPDSLETSVFRVAKAAKISPRRAALVLAERAETGLASGRMGIGSPEADAAALRGLAQLYGSRFKALVLDELREDLQQTASKIGVHPRTLAEGLVLLLEHGVVAIEPRAEALAYLRHLADRRVDGSVSRRGIVPGYA